MKTVGKLAALCVIFVAACGDDTLVQPFEPEGLQPARLEFHGDPARVTIPQTATAGVPFEISIQTYGGGCIEAGPTPVKLLGGTLDIRPLDDFPPPESLCSADVRFNDHSVTYTVDAPMTLEVVVHGVRVSEAGREDVTVTGTIVVSGG